MPHSHFRLLCVFLDGQRVWFAVKIILPREPSRSGPARFGSPREDTEVAEDGPHLWSPRSCRVLKVANLVCDVCFLVAAAKGEPPHLRTVTLPLFGSVIDQGQPIDDRCLLHQECD